MQKLNARSHIPLAALALFFGSGAAICADDPCAGFTWNVSHERALFATAAQRIAAGRDAASAPRVSADRLYELTLTEQDKVQFSAAPGKKPRGEKPYAGMVRLRLSAAALYRFSIDQGAWLDVIASDQPITSADFQGRSGCEAPHKIVQFLLPAGRDVIVQLSGAEGPQARLTVTPVPDTAGTK
jgi:hypothetical protein